MVPLPAHDMKDQTHSWIWCCLGYGKRYGQDLSIIPSAWQKERFLCHFWKMLHAAVLEVGTEGLPEQWLCLHVLKKKMGRNSLLEKKERESFFLEPMLGWDSLGPFPDISDLDPVCVKRGLKSFLSSLTLSSPSQQLHVSAWSPVRVQSSISAGGPVCRAHMAPLKSWSQRRQSMTSCETYSREQKGLGTVFSTVFQSFRTFAHVVWVLWTTGLSWS